MSTELMLIIAALAVGIVVYYFWVATSHKTSKTETLPESEPLPPQPAPEPTVDPVVEVLKAASKKKAPVKKSRAKK